MNRRDGLPSIHPSSFILHPSEDNGPGSGRPTRRCNMKIVVIGGSGLIGKKLVPILRQQGHEAISASPSSGVNALTGEGLAGALAGANVVVDVSNSPSWADAAAERLLGNPPRHHLAAAAAA